MRLPCRDETTFSVSLGCLNSAHPQLKITNLFIHYQEILALRWQTQNLPLESVNIHAAHCNKLAKSPTLLGDSCLHPEVFLLHVFSLIFVG